MTDPTVAIIRTPRASYVVKRISRAPLLYVAFITTAELGDEHLHRDGRSQADALRAIVDHMSHTAIVVAQISQFLSGRG